ncbi:hypothetical protein Ancab_035643 [Ancistrocladus abbreviatus]
MPPRSRISRENRGSIRPGGAPINPSRENSSSVNTTSRGPRARSSPIGRSGRGCCRAADEGGSGGESPLYSDPYMEDTEAVERSSDGTQDYGDSSSLKFKTTAKEGFSTPDEEESEWESRRGVEEETSGKRSILKDDENEHSRKKGKKNGDGDDDAGAGADASSGA